MLTIYDFNPKPYEYDANIDPRVWHANQFAMRNFIAYPTILLWELGGPETPESITSKSCFKECRRCRGAVTFSTDAHPCTCCSGVGMEIYSLTLEDLCDA